MSGFLVQWNVVRLDMIVSAIIYHKNSLKLNKYYAEKFSKATGIKIKSQHWGGNRQLSMEVIDVEFF